MLGQFTTIPNALFLDDRLPRHCIVIYGVLQAHAGIDGRIFPSYETIAKEAGLHRATVIRLMKRLVAYGYVAKERGTFTGTDKQASNYYYLNPNPELLKAKNVDNLPTYPHKEAQNATPDGLQNATPNNNRYEIKNARENSNIINLPIRTHAKPANDDSGDETCRPSACETVEILGQAGQKKQKMSFDASAGATFSENYMQKRTEVI